MRRALYLGAGSSPLEPAVVIKGLAPMDELISLDCNKDHNPDVVWDLNIVPWPFEDNYFDQVHAYEILEHLGTQGDANAFFAHFYEIWRILKNGGLLFGSCPGENSAWLLAEPGHRRVILPRTLNFLNQSFYDQVGTTSASDYRHIWKGNLVYLWSGENSQAGHSFILQAKDKPGPDCLTIDMEAACEV